MELVQWLLTSDNADFFVLQEHLRKYEVAHPPLFKTFFHHNTNKAFFQLPTKQSIRAISNICNAYRIQSVHEVGAGLGLFSAVASKLSLLHWSASDTEIQPFTFTKIEQKKFSEVRYFDCIFCSWLNYYVEEQFVYMIKKHQPKLVLLLEEDVDGACHSIYTNEQLKQYYVIHKVPCLSLSKLDYFRNDKFRGNKYQCRTLMTVFIRKDIYNGEDIFEVVGYENMGKYIHLTEDYQLQDKEFFNS